MTGDTHRVNGIKPGIRTLGHRAEPNCAVWLVNDLALIWFQTTQHELLQRRLHGCLSAAQGLDQIGFVH